MRWNVISKLLMAGTLPRSTARPTQYVLRKSTQIYITEHGGPIGQTPHTI